jgi:hypothetical protein
VSVPLMATPFVSNCLAKTGRAMDDTAPPNNDDGRTACICFVHY